MNPVQMWRYQDAARFLALPLATLRGLVARRRIPHHRVGPRLVLFNPQEVKEWLEAHRVAALVGR
jgi:excisionase family DNA binding protein